MINVVFQATLMEDPRQDTKSNKSNSMHVFLNISGKMDAKDPQNDRYKKALFMQGSVWGRLAENCMTYLKKGAHILVFGTLYDVSTNESNGKTYLNTSVNINNIEFLDRANNNTTTNNAIQNQPVQNNQMGMMPPQPQVQQNMNNGEVQAPPWMQQGASMGGGNNLAASFFG